MKFLFSLACLTLVTNSQAAIISIIYTPGQKQNVQLIESRFIQKYKIPRDIIQVKASLSCRSFDKRYLELCLNKKGELILLSNSNIKNIIKSLTNFGPRGRYE